MHGEKAGDIMDIEFIRVNPKMFDECAEVIRNSFITVADDFKLTKVNAPTNPAFIESDAIRLMYDKQTEMYAVTESSVTIGFIAIEKADDGIYYMEKLAVLPSCRHKGYGKAIMDFVFDHVKGSGGKKVSIGIINENEILKNWYINYGFKETGTKVFKHLPFTVCFMEKYI